MARQAQRAGLAEARTFALAEEIARLRAALPGDELRAAFLGQQIKSGGADAAKLKELLAAAEQMGIADKRVPAQR